MKDSIVYEFGLYCENQVLRVFSQSIFFIGSIFGTIFFTFFQMRRKRFLVLSWIFTFVGLLGSGLSPSVEYFWFFWAFTGFSSYSCYVMANTMTKEQSGLFIHNSDFHEFILVSEFYQKASIFFFIFWGGAQIIFATIFEYVTTNWRYLILFVMALPAFIIIFFIYFLKESPRYLYFTEGKLTEAINTLNEIAVINKKETFSSEEIDKLTHHYQNEMEKRYNYWHLFSFPSLRRITIPTGLVNSAFDVTYYSIQFSFSSLGLSLFKNALYVGFGEILVYLVASYIFFRFRIKHSKSSLSLNYQGKKWFPLVI